MGRESANVEHAHAGRDVQSHPDPARRRREPFHEESHREVEQDAGGNQPVQDDRHERVAMCGLL